MAHESAEAEMILRRDGKPTRKRVGGPVALNARMVRMIALMINGHGDDPSRTPYGVYDAAAAVGYRRKAARELAKSQVFVDAYNAALAAAVADRDPPDPCPSLVYVRSEMTWDWRNERNRLLRARREADERRRASEEKLAHQQFGTPRPVSTASTSAGYIIRLQQPETEESPDD